MTESFIIPILSNVAGTAYGIASVDGPLGSRQGCKFLTEILTGTQAGIEPGTYMSRVGRACMGNNRRPRALARNSARTIWEHSVRRKLGEPFDI